MAKCRVKAKIESFGFLFRKKSIILSFFLNLFNKLAFAYRVAKLKLFASISATDAKPRNVVGNYTERPVNEENIDIYTFNFTDTNHVFSEFWRFSQNCKGETS